jgi:two-component system, NtrC family, sensor kinase
MTRTISLSLNIRQKVVAGLIICMSATGFIGGISYQYLCDIDRKQTIGTLVDDLSNIILEIRRYEKNFLLYGSLDDLKENQEYLEMGGRLLASVIPEVTDLKVAPEFSKLKHSFQEYEKAMRKMSDCIARDPKNCTDLENHLRESGKNMVNISISLVDFERNRIQAIIHRLKTNLLISIALMLGVGGFMARTVARKIIYPLKLIEKNTKRVAEGDFSPIPLPSTRDETQRVVAAFNRMVTELERRHEQILQARKLSAIGILTSGVAHQLNNPLNNISTSCQILMEEIDKAGPEFVRRMLGNVEQEIRRARDIVKGLLEFSRERNFEPKPVGLRKFIEDTVRLISSNMAANIEIEVDVPNDLILNIDSHKMQEALLNLLMNAVQAIGDTPGHIRIAATSEPSHHQDIITIEDTGPGIPEKDLGMIFDPFFTTKEVGLGTGLGLSIVYGIIQKHYGTITAHSKVGEGTRFIIRLPMNKPIA